MVRLPTVDNVNWQLPAPPTSEALQLSTPSVTVTVPSGTTPSAVTRTVIVTADPATEGSGESLVMAVLVGTVRTTITSEVAPPNPLAVNTSRRGPSAPPIARSVYTTLPFASLPSWRVAPRSPPSPPPLAARRGSGVPLPASSAPRGGGPNTTTSVRGSPAPSRTWITG